MLMNQAHRRWDGGSRRKDFKQDYRKRAGEHNQDDGPGGTSGYSFLTNHRGRRPTAHADSWHMAGKLITSQQDGGHRPRSILDAPHFFRFANAFCTSSAVNEMLQVSPLSARILRATRRVIGSRMS